MFYCFPRWTWTEINYWSRDQQLCKPFGRERRSVQKLYDKMADSDGEVRGLALDLFFEDFVDDVESNLYEEFNRKMQKWIMLGYFPNYS